MCTSTKRLTVHRDLRARAPGGDAEGSNTTLAHTAGHDPAGLMGIVIRLVNITKLLARREDAAFESDRSRLLLLP